MTQMQERLQPRSENSVAGEEDADQNLAEIQRLQHELDRTRHELAIANQIRDHVGRTMAGVWHSWTWRATWPVQAILRMLGRGAVGLDKLVPISPAERLSDGAWHTRGAAMFLVPMVPARGWVRLRAKMECSSGSRAYFYFNSCGAFNPHEICDLGAIAPGENEIDQFIFTPSPVFAGRFDPVRHGEVILRQFSLAPVSRLGMYLEVTAKNIRAAMGMTGGRKPSFLIGLKLLATGKWATFFQQLHLNAKPVHVLAPGLEYHGWMSSNAMTDMRRAEMKRQIGEWTNPPKISVILPVYDVAENYLRACLDSVCEQVYENWELCAADDASPSPHVRKVLEEYAGRDPRIKVAYRQTNGNISAASNTALQLASGEYVAFLDHDDEIAEHALFTMAQAIVSDRSLDLIYSDEDKLSANGLRSDPFFKPDWSPEYFLSCMYTCHLMVVKRELVQRTGGFRSEFDTAQDYDLVLRMLGHKPKIRHIPDVLYHWRTIASSSAATRDIKPASHVRGQKAIEEYLAKKEQSAKVLDGPAAGCHVVRYDVIGHPRVSIVIPSACQKVHHNGQETWLVLDCIKSIRAKSTYDNVEILVVHRGEIAAELMQQFALLGVRTFDYDFDFNWSAVNDVGAAAATGEYLLFLNDDMEVIAADWLEWMLGYAQQPEIGAVGAKLIYSDGSLQHTGVLLPAGNPTHAYYRHPGTQVGYYFSAVLPRNFSGVTGACLMTRKSTFDSLGGFDSTLPLNYNDVEYCLRLLDRNLRIVYVPQAELYHYESKTRDAIVRQNEVDAIHRIWKPKYNWDPYYNPNLSVATGEFITDPNVTAPATLTGRVSEGPGGRGPRKNQSFDREKWQKQRWEIAREYLKGEGVEIGALHQPLKVPSSAHVKYVDRYDEDGLREHYPELREFNLVKVDLLDDGETLGTLQDESLDFVICNHMLEHCENPLGSMRNHLRKVRPGGIVYYAVPNKWKTFDIDRALTPFSHLVEDDQKGPEHSRREHYLQWATLVNGIGPEAAEQAAEELMQRNYSIHFHVWDDISFRKFISSAEEYLDGMFIAEEVINNEMEIIAVLRRR